MHGGKGWLKFLGILSILQGVVAALTLGFAVFSLFIGGLGMLGALLES